MDERTRFYTFQAEVFSEDTPGGKVSRKEMGGCR
jgi:AMMECR1 domain-containing protein